MVRITVTIVQGNTLLNSVSPAIDTLASRCMSVRVQRVISHKQKFFYIVELICLCQCSRIWHKIVSLKCLKNPSACRGEVVLVLEDDRIHCCLQICREVTHATFRPRRAPKLHRVSARR